MITTSFLVDITLRGGGHVIDETTSFKSIKQRKKICFSKIFAAKNKWWPHDVLLRLEEFTGCTRTRKMRRTASDRRDGVAGRCTQVRKGRLEERWRG